MYQEDISSRKYIKTYFLIINRGELMVIGK